VQKVFIFPPHEPYLKRQFLDHLSSAFRPQHGFLSTAMPSSEKVFELGNTADLHGYGKIKCGWQCGGTVALGVGV
jgi:hypothetical protein